MAIENEIKLLGINIDETTIALEEIGAIFVYDRFLRNTIFYTFKLTDNEYVRVRDDSSEVTLTYKSIQSDGISTIEQEVVVNSYDDAINLLFSLGLKKKRVDEKRRRRYQLNNAIIDIDLWPHIPPYIEIEASSEQDIKSACDSLGLKFSNRFIGNTLDVFRYYGIDPNVITEMSFPKKEKVS